MAYLNYLSFIRRFSDNSLLLYVLAGDNEPAGHIDPIKIISAVKFFDNKTYW